MDEDDITRLFMQVASNAADLPDEVRQVFAALVTTTVEYRDRMKRDMGVTVTVAEVRSALDGFYGALRTGQLPQTDRAVVMDLVKLWLDALKPYL